MFKATFIDLSAEAHNHFRYNVPHYHTLPISVTPGGYRVYVADEDMFNKMLAIVNDGETGIKPKDFKCFNSVSAVVLPIITTPPATPFIPKTVSVTQELHELLNTKIEGYSLIPKTAIENGCSLYIHDEAIFTQIVKIADAARVMGEPQGTQGNFSYMDAVEFTSFSIGSGSGPIVYMDSAPTTEDGMVIPADAPKLLNTHELNAEVLGLDNTPAAAVEEQVTEGLSPIVTSELLGTVGDLITRSAEITNFKPQRLCLSLSAYLQLSKNPNFADLPVLSKNTSNELGPHGHHCVVLVNTLSLKEAIQAQLDLNPDVAERIDYSFTEYVADKFDSDSQEVDLSANAIFPARSVETTKYVELLEGALDAYTLNGPINGVDFSQQAEELKAIVKNHFADMHNVKTATDTEQRDQVYSPTEPLSGDIEAAIITLGLNSTKALCNLGRAAYATLMRTGDAHKAEVEIVDGLIKQHNKADLYLPTRAQDVALKALTYLLPKTVTYAKANALSGVPPYLQVLKLYHATANVVSNELTPLKPIKTQESWLKEKLSGLQMREGDFTDFFSLWTAVPAPAKGKILAQGSFDRLAYNETQPEEQPMIKVAMRVSPKLITRLTEQLPASGFYATGNVVVINGEENLFHVLRIIGVTGDFKYGHDFNFMSVADSHAICYPEAEPVKEDKVYGTYGYSGTHSPNWYTKVTAEQWEQVMRIVDNSPSPGLRHLGTQFTALWQAHGFVRGFLDLHQLSPVPPSEAVKQEVYSIFSILTPMLVFSAKSTAGDAYGSLIRYLTNDVEEYEASFKQFVSSDFNPIPYGQFNSNPPLWDSGFGLAQRCGVGPKSWPKYMAPSATPGWDTPKQVAKHTFTTGGPYEQQAILPGWHNTIAQQDKPVLWPKLVSGGGEVQRLLQFSITYGVQLPPFSVDGNGVLDLTPVIKSLQEALDEAIKQHGSDNLSVRMVDTYYSLIPFICPPLYQHGFSSNNRVEQLANVYLDLVRKAEAASQGSSEHMWQSYLKETNGNNVEAMKRGLNQMRELNQAWPTPANKGVRVTVWPMINMFTAHGTKCVDVLNDVSRCCGFNIPVTTDQNGNIDLSAWIKRIDGFVQSASRSQFTQEAITLLAQAAILLKPDNFVFAGTFDENPLSFMYGSLVELLK